MSEEDILKQIVKYKLFANILGTPQWHKTQLQDLLCMVEHFGMPQFFLTLTVDETSFFQWKKLLTLKKLQNKYIHR